MEEKAKYGPVGYSICLPDDVLRPASECRTPTPREISCALEHARLSVSAAAALLGVKGRTIRRWTAGEAEIPYAAWSILCYQAGYPEIWV